MRAINKIASPARDKVRSAYDQVISWGMEEGVEIGIEKGREEERINKSFQVFKKRYPDGPIRSRSDHTHRSFRRDRHLLVCYAEGKPGCGAA
jgi:hypothetical protein